jgi:hypothetical protein
MKKIYFEKAASEAEIQKKQRYIDAINALSAELEIEGITLTNEILTNSVNEGTGFIGKLLVEGAVSQYEKAGIKVNSVLHATLQQNSYDVAARFEKLILPVRVTQQGVGHGPDLVNIIEEKAVFTEAEKKAIEQKHTIHLKKEDEELFTQLERVAGVINTMEQKLYEAGEMSLITNLEILATEPSFIVDANLQKQLRNDIPIMLDEAGAITVNPGYFNR